MMNLQKMKYKPLPENITIQKSNIEGLGLFALEFIDKNKTLGVSHVKHKDYLNGYIRTPLGGFINHSDDPNCDKIKLFFTNEDKQPTYNFSKWNLVTIKDIKEGEELTLTYTFYKI